MQTDFNPRPRIIRKGNQFSYLIPARFPFLCFNVFFNYFQIIFSKITFQNSESNYGPRRIICFVNRNESHSGHYGCKQLSLYCLKLIEVGCNGLVSKNLCGSRISDSWCQSGLMMTIQWKPIFNETNIILEILQRCIEYKLLL